MAEGKRLASVSDICGACDTNFALKYCSECPMKLCGTCAKAHHKFGITKNHRLTVIRNTASSQKSSYESVDRGKCVEHGNTVYTNMCKQCVQLTCDLCKPDHIDHDLQHLNDDVKLYQKVCGKQIQMLIDDVSELEEIKSILESNTSTYDEAIDVVDQWEIDLVKMVKGKADKLRQQLKQLKDDNFKALQDKVNGLMARLQQVDCTLVKLTDIRKSMNMNELAKELSASQSLLAKLESYKSELQPLPPPVTVYQLLPYGDKLKDVDDDLSQVFATEDIIKIVEFGRYASNKGPQPVAAWYFTSANKGKDLSRAGGNPLMMTNIDYGPGPKGDINGSVFFPVPYTDQSIAVMNPTDRLRFDKAMTFVTEVFITGANYGPLFDYTTNDEYGTRLWLNPNGTSLWVDETGFTFAADGALQLNTWHKIATVWDVSAVSIYVDGNLVMSQKGNVDLSKTRTGNLHIGCWTGSSYRIQGRISSASFYNVALTEKEIKEMSVKQ